MITSTRTGDVAVTVAVRATCVRRAISPNQSPAAELGDRLPVLRDLAVPSTRTKNSRPGRPSRVSTWPSRRSISSAMSATSRSSAFEHPAKSGTLLQQLDLRVLAEAHAAILIPPRANGNQVWTSSRCRVMLSGARKRIQLRQVKLERRLGMKAHARVVAVLHRRSGVSVAGSRRRLEAARQLGVLGGTALLRHGQPTRRALATRRRAPLHEVHGHDQPERRNVEPHERKAHVDVDGHHRRRRHTSGRPADDPNDQPSTASSSRAPCRRASARLLVQRPHRTVLNFPANCNPQVYDPLIFRTSTTATAAATRLTAVAQFKEKGSDDQPNDPNEPPRLGAHDVRGQHRRGPVLGVSERGDRPPDVHRGQPVHKFPLGPVHAGQPLHREPHRGAGDGNRDSARTARANRHDLR